ncbi:hypothetical protein [Myxococcus landrumensis]|uniref:Uncharacterized protein n=1 Tax=Myxococcus landrumensis TaxID=2813577 RepID=A0ABX7NCI3_9BACT|nr:hypothetical protein [Myxococcus landrumus]QSQ14018.1 hypothetical protein JY572_37845 [Myxococcus landrumus]
MTTETAIVPTQPNGLASQRASVSRELLAIDTEQRKVLAEYVAKHMVKGQDFGVIPGTDKPTLLKPGAEKLTDLFRCTPKFSLVKEFSKEDWEAGFFKYTFRCRLMQRDTEAVLAEGFGSANSRESRYRWRSAKRVCPECSKSDALNKSKPPREGYYCWDKKGGCGAQFAANDKRITEQVLGRVENIDIADLDNTILKMAKKRALVDGAIALARCSDMFTQDVEDLMDMATEGDEPAPKAAPPAREPPKAEVLPPEQPVQRKTKQAEVTNFEKQGASGFGTQRDYVNHPPTPAEIVEDVAARAKQGRLTAEQKAKADQVAKALGGTVETDAPQSADDIASMIVAESEVVEASEDFGRLAARAKLLPVGTNARKKVSAALKAAAARLGIQEGKAKPARQPGED